MSNELIVDTIQKGSLESFDSAVILDQWLDNLGDSITISSVTNPETEGDGELTVSSVGKNSGTYTRQSDGTTYSAGQVITYSVAGGTDGITYRVRFQATLSNSAIVEVVQPIEIVD